MSNIRFTGLAFFVLAWIYLAGSELKITWRDYLGTKFYLGETHLRFILPCNSYQEIKKLNTCFLVIKVLVLRIVVDEEVDEV